MMSKSYEQWKADRVVNPESERSRRYFEEFLEGFKYGLDDAANATPEEIADEIAVHLITLNAFDQCRFPTEENAILTDEQLMSLAHMGGESFAMLHYYALVFMVVHKDGSLGPVHEGAVRNETLH